VRLARQGGLSLPGGKEEGNIFSLVLRRGRKHRKTFNAFSARGSASSYCYQKKGKKMPLHNHGQEGKRK